MNGNEMDRTNRLLNILQGLVLLMAVLLLYVAGKSNAPEVIYLEPVIHINLQLEEPNNLEEIEEEYTTLEQLAMPEIEPRYGFTEEEIYLLAVLLSGSKDVDGDGEYDIDFSKQDNHQQIALVMNVVMNRVNSDKFSQNTVSEVVWAPGQFSLMPRWVNGLPQVSDTTLKVVREWCRSYDTYEPESQVIPDSHLYFYGNGTINISRERW